MDNKTENKAPENNTESSPVKEKDNAEQEKNVKKHSCLPGMLAVAVICLAAGFAAGYFLPDALGFGHGAKKGQDATESDALTPEQAYSYLRGDADLDPETSDLAGQSVSTEAADLTGSDVSAEDESEVVAEYDGGTITVGTLLEKYNELYALAVFSGDASEGTDVILQKALNEVLRDAITYDHAREMGLTEYTAEDEKAIAVLAEENGCDVESVRADYWKTKLYAALTADVSVTDEEVDSEYQRLLTEQQSDTASYLTRLEEGGIIVYAPTDARKIVYVRNVFSDEDALAYASADETEQAELIAKYTVDLGNFDGKTYKEGDMPDGAVCLWITVDAEMEDEELTQALLSMKKDGKLHLITTAKGVTLAVCLDEKEAGTTELSKELTATIRQTLTENAANLLYDSTLDSWVESANVVKHLEVLN